jgi:transcription elongation factor Elf1
MKKKTTREFHITWKELCMALNIDAENLDMVTSVPEYNQEKGNFGRLIVRMKTEDTNKVIPLLGPEPPAYTKYFNCKTCGAYYPESRLDRIDEDGTCTCRSCAIPIEGDYSVFGNCRVCTARRPLSFLKEIITEEGTFNYCPEHVPDIPLKGLKFNVQFRLDSKNMTTSFKCDFCDKFKTSENIAGLTVDKEIVCEDCKEDVGKALYSYCKRCEQFFPLSQLTEHSLQAGTFKFCEKCGDGMV